MTTLTPPPGAADLTPDSGPVSTAGTGPGAGFYPVPAHHHRHQVVERRWDGDVWLAETRPAAADEALPRYHRRVLRFLRTPGWALLLVYAVCTATCMALVARDPDATRPEGVVWLLPPAAFVASLAVMGGVFLYLDRRLRFDQVPERRAAVAWGVVAGAVGVGVALLFEVGLPRLLGSTDRVYGWVWIAGPAEETGKLLVPVVLWYLGRFRLPRQGVLLVVSSAATFGILEAARYGLSPDKFTFSRSFGEVLHVLLTGFVAGVAWRAAWGRRSWFTGAGVLALLVAMALHSVNDAAVLSTTLPKVLGAATVYVIAVLYVLFKRANRQLVPPDNVGAVSPRWRPVAPHPADAGS